MSKKAVNNREILSWFHRHFSSQAFNGRLQLGYRSAGSSAVLPLFTSDRGQMKTVILENMTFHSTMDYYITANTVSGVKRRRDQLFSLENIVIDLDCHCEPALSSMELDYRIDKILHQMSHKTDLPKPNSVVRTGRGLQLWWAIVPCHAKCKPYYDEVKQEFMSSLESILGDFEGLSVFSVDKTASNNPVGYFRLPATFNTKVKQKALFTVHEDVAPYVLQDLVALVKTWQEEPDLPKTSQWNQGTFPENQGKIRNVLEKLAKTDYSSSEISILKNFHTLGFFRSRQLIQLRHLRNAPIGQEERNNFCFLLYNTLLPSFGEEKAMEKLMAFNAGFLVPLSPEELEGVICTAKRKGGYKYSNQKIIEFLNVTPEEQTKIGLYQGNFKQYTRVSSHPSRQAAAALVKETRDKNILDLAEKGLKLKEIAQELQISTPTIRKILKNQGGSLANRLHQKIFSLFQESLPLDEIALSCQCSLRTVRRYLAKTPELAHRS